MSDRRYAVVFSAAARLILAGYLVVSASVVDGGDENAQQLAFFEAKIRPVLVQHCYECHSAKSDAGKGGLRLDSSTALLAGGDSGTPIVRGNADDSLLISALRYDGLEMPPAGKLPDHVIRDFETWVNSGAVDPRTAAVPEDAHRGIDIAAGREFWAFQPIRDHRVPQTRQKFGNSIDAFVNAKLEAADLPVSVAAERSALIRRLYYDLIGLPPTLEERRHAEGAGGGDELSIEGLVDRLLNSTQFGVHWGRHWLDVARYADSNGGDFNATFHNAWKYRDYVIDAMNNDKPFDQFIREQLAGDLLPFDTDYQRTEQLIATGFLMLGTKMLSERDKDKLQMDVVDEQISTVGSAFLGMTLGCARCHDHKFDPIPTDDYYALAGIFRSTRTLEGESQKYVSTWTRTALPAEPSHIAAVREFEAQKKSLDDDLKKLKKSVAALEKQVSQTNGFLVDDISAKTTGVWKSSTLSPGFVGKQYLHDDNKAKGRMSISFPWQAPRSGIYEVQLSYLAGSGRADNVPVTIQHADGTTDIRLNQTKKPALDGLFAAVGRFNFRAEMAATVTISNADTDGHVIADAVRFVEVDGAGKIVPREQIAGSPLAEEIQQQQAQVQQIEQQLKDLAKHAPPPLPEAIAVADLPEIGDCRICIRGEHRNPGDVVPRRFLQVAAYEGQPGIPESQSGRKELAEWIASPNNPLTARVIVNRVWSHLLGEGLVRSVDNFGQLGDRPTHPELLDHLAARFCTPVGRQTEFGAAGLGWSIKALVREIVLTDAYQRSTAHAEIAWQKDPENRLLWKAHRKRLPAESIRDTVLALSGQLDLSPGGSPVQGLGTLVKDNSANAENYESQESFHRSAYLPIIRNELPAMLTVFDFADPDLVTGKRAVTNVPAQALLLMNSPFIMNGARKTAQRLCTGNTTDDELITRTYQAILCRAPTDEEHERAMGFLQSVGSAASTNAEVDVDRLSRFIHVLFASTEFRMLN
ncbi:MAG: DUF1553 domain-containing protein [Planctomycetaceae bacterium]